MPHIVPKVQNKCLLNASKYFINVFNFKGNFGTNKFGPQCNRNLVMPSHPQVCDR